MRKFSFISLLLALVFALPLSLPQPLKAQDPVFVKIGTGGVTGVYYPVGAAICRLVEKGRRAGEHNIRCQ